VGSENSDKGGHTTQVVVAVIGLVGVLGGALIANWDKLFPRVQSQVAPVPEKSDFPKPSRSDAPRRSSVATPPAVSDVSISGVWRDLNMGTVYQVSQDGQTFRFSGSHPTFESSGLGTILESSYETRYRQGGISTGRCAGELSLDGKRMVSRCMDSATSQWISLVVR
jgi:hypothetical protein